MISIQVTGIQGVGKSTIMDVVKDQFLDIVFKDYADFMLLALGYGDKDILGELSKEKRTPLYKNASGKLHSFLNTNDYGALVLESHISVLLPDNTFLIFAAEGFKNCNTAGMIVIEAKPEEIYSRRKNDKDRKREVGTINSIKKHQDVNHKQAIKICDDISVPLFFIRNDKVDNCAIQVSDILNKLIYSS